MNEVWMMCVGGQMMIQKHRAYGFFLCGSGLLLSSRPAKGPLKIQLFSVD